MIALAGIQRLDILKSLYESIYLPQAVHDEILLGGRHFTGLEEYRKINWIKISKLQQPGDPLLATVLDTGEASVIQLAREIGVHKILMDERKGRRVARDVYGLQVIGTARLLTEAKEAHLISSVKEMLQQMKSAGYWIHDKIIEAAIKAVKE
jgi:predicted nucleic acid-binding protein